MRMSVVSPFEAVCSAAAIVRAAVAERDPALKLTTTSCIGRPAWQASYTKGGWRHAATVDKATGFPLRYVLADVRHPVTHRSCLLYTSDAADEEDSVGLGGRRIIKKNKKNQHKKR